MKITQKRTQKSNSTHKSYSKFREKRRTLREKNKKLAGLQLTETLNNYAQTGLEYTKILNHNNLKIYQLHAHSKHVGI